MIPEMMRGAVEMVFRTMAQRDVQLLRHWSSNRPLISTSELAEGHGLIVIATVGFTGRANGVVCLYLSQTLATQLTGDILGLDATDPEHGGFEIVKDAIVELTNVTAGSFKSHLCGLGLSCHLTIPSILQGPPAPIDEVANTSRWTFEFETRGARFVVDVLCNPAL